MLQLDTFFAKTLERNNVWVHPLLYFVRSQHLTRFVYEQLKLILYLHRYAKLGLLFRLRLLLAHTFCILYSLDPRFAFMMSHFEIQYICTQKKALKWKWQIPSASFHTTRTTWLHFKYINKRKNVKKLRRSFNYYYFFDVYFLFQYTCILLYIYS